MQETASAIKTYKLDENHSTVRFWARHLMISKVHGELSDVTGTVEYNESDPKKSNIDIKIGVASLTTRQEQRDNHLKSADFLEMEKFPYITFKSTAITPTGKNKWEIVGDLTIRGATRSVSFQAETTDEVPSPFGGYKIGATAEGEINREAFGIMWNQMLETGGVMVGKEIHFEIDVELDRS